MYCSATCESRVSLSCIPDGDAGTRVKLATMAGLVRRYKTHPLVRLTAQQLTRHLQSYDQVGEVQALHGYVRDEIRFVEDVSCVETIQSPAYTLSVGAGDCDCKCTCLGALLASIGYRPCFFCIGFDGGPHEHVLAGVHLGTRRLPLETVIPAGSMGPGSAEIGWLPPDADPVWPWSV